jgi:hypothetical protein
MGVTVYTLASRRDESLVKDFWTHTAMLRRQLTGITWASPLYVENMVNVNALVPTEAGLYVVIGCLSPTLVSALLDEPALREIVDGAELKIPFILSACAWNEWPCPFADKVPLVRKAVAEQGRQKDSILSEAVGRLRGALRPYWQGR